MGTKFSLERDFVHHVGALVRSRGGMFVRLESHATAPGLPDAFMALGGDDWFIEFKHMRTMTMTSDHLPVRVVPWRPGQVAWAMEYMLAHRKVTAGGIMHKCAWTFISSPAGVHMVRMAHAFDGNRVSGHPEDVFYFPDLASFGSAFVKVLLTRSVVTG